MYIYITEDKIEVEHSEKESLEKIAENLSDVWKKKAIFQNRKTKEWKLILWPRSSIG